MTESDQRKRIEDYLLNHTTMTLATVGSEGPWAAAVFYAHDADLSLYFKSNPKTRHIRDLATSDQVALTIHDDGQSWKSLRGLQIFGSCSRVSDHELSRVERCYMEKFPFLGAISGVSLNAEERILAERLKNTPYFQLRPHSIRFIDNGLGFGNKTEIRMA